MTNQHIKELDGIRGIAILLVMSFHTFQRASYFTQNKILIFLAALSRVGWAGVDIFFVLSGFLITSILLAEKDENNYFKFFYARRALRIFPLYYLFIIVMVLGMPLIAADYVQSIYHDIPILALYLQNWIWVGLFHAELPLHLSATWSLAVEEQFYLIWPAVVYYFSDRNLKNIILTVIGFVILSRCYTAFFFSNAVQVSSFFYFSTFGRFEELMFGALVALIVFNSSIDRKYIRWLPCVTSTSLVLFAIVSVTAFPAVEPFKGNRFVTAFSYTLLSIFSASLILFIVSHQQKSWIHKLLASKPMTFFGKYSYAMYIFHMPISIMLISPFVNLNQKGWWMYVLYISSVFGLTIIGSLLSWHLLEKRMLSLKRYFQNE